MHRDGDHVLHISLEYRHLHIMEDGFRSACGQSKSPTCVHIRIRKLQSLAVMANSGILGGA